jgi:hypothetical protein
VYNLNVQQLMLPGIKCWDYEKISLLFSGAEVQAILAVPLLEEIQEDKLIWHEEKDGLYMVWSGYHRKLMEEKLQRGGPRA